NPTVLPVRVKAVNNTYADRVETCIDEHIADPATTPVINDQRRIARQTALEIFHPSHLTRIWCPQRQPFDVMDTVNRRYDHQIASGSKSLTTQRSSIAAVKSASSALPN